MYEHTSCEVHHENPCSVRQRTKKFSQHEDADLCLRGAWRAGAHVLILIAMIELLYNGDLEGADAPSSVFSRWQNVGSGWISGCVAGL